MRELNFVTLSSGSIPSQVSSSQFKEMGTDRSVLVVTPVFAIAVPDLTNSG